MRNAWKLAVGLLVTVLGVQAKEVQVKSRFVSLGLFKNELTVVRKAVSLPGPGTYRIDDIPEPVHGTFWIESGSEIKARMTLKEVDVPLRRNAGTNFQEELAGCEVVIHFRDGEIPPASGKVIAIEHARDEYMWDRAGRNTRSNIYDSSPPSSSQGRFLILENPDGRTYIDSSMIAYLHAGNWNRTIRQRRPVLLLTVPKTDGKPTEVFFSYLARGVSWAPSYRVDITDPDTLILEQSAVIKNELDDIEDAEIALISGFPSVQFSHVTSPFSLNTTWAQFFQQINRRISPAHATTSNVALQQAITVNDVRFANRMDLSAIPFGEGVDLHYQSLGRQTLSEGDSLLAHTASGKARYERIVEWIVPDTRQANGRYIQDYERQQDPEKYEEAAWDAVRFKNPLSFPMTTAPAMIVSNGRFNGQRMTYWVNTGEETTLHITKALSVRTHHVEHEEPGKREIVYVAGNDYRKVEVKGELRINNHRKEDVSMVIRRRFSGELTGAEGSPECVLREEGVYSVNKRNELIWALDLKAGEEKALMYQYSVLVDN